RMREPGEAARDELAVVRVLGELEVAHEGGDRVVDLPLLLVSEAEAAVADRVGGREAHRFLIRGRGARALAGEEQAVPALVGRARGLAVGGGLLLLEGLRERDLADGPVALGARRVNVPRGAAALRVSLLLLRARLRGDRDVLAVRRGGGPLRL